MGIMVVRGKHVKCGMSKAEWERVKTLPAYNEHMLHLSAPILKIPHPAILNALMPVAGRGTTYNVGRNAAKRQERQKKLTA